MDSATYLAVDFGASNGRVIAGSVKETSEGKELVMQEIHRFPNRPVKIGDFLYWDFPALFAEMIEGLSKAAQKLSDVKSIGIDTWGVDFGLIDRQGNLVGNPICYRDQHTLGMVEEFASRNDLSAHYAETGIQILPINTLFRLMAMRKDDDPKLEIARHLLFMPDLFGFYLTGGLGNEYTIASTSELLKAGDHRWNVPLMEKIGINPDLFGEIIYPGASRGRILKEVREQTGLPEDVEVIAVGSHDTASAVFAMADNFSEGETAFLSSGTWSLLGVVLDSPMLSEEARLADYTNEGAVGGKTRLLTNITGLWILQQLVADWRKHGMEADWPTLTKEGMESSFSGVINVDDPVFQKPEGMEETIRQYCKNAGIEQPVTRGDFVRCVCESLAERYKKAIDNLNSLLPAPVKRMVVFGGGSKNRLLMNLTAEKTGVEIILKDAEATAAGNIIMQALANGRIADKNEITKITYL